ncbi:hypothetical protein N7489_008776 [Penicillium chrysogenum]|uniref:Uncharacterized protein n=1 Tax=Penicillium chrysogenum TaxID=5076 RepID=A0ABQ8X161_PENCH|nr:uncharacterized protein N7489_008776 [Penicillium chrysogenum]KAJ5228068.1 hypothetical protein N7489_008776 [Penicillium chrysogenum]KAJ5284300.1 hypothetical protein N7505_002280 [Penicillium chrysogenum]KAJ5286207.1 hypothetical protein N7524_001513 [Penicillium chrysogenum]KAJ6167575.1 hypothetical protein N7497_000418 [Penicillium chrysogenum]
MTSVQTYYEQAEVSNWLDAIYGDNGSIDPRTLEVHQVMTTDHDTHNDTCHHDQTSLSEQEPSSQLPRSSFDLQALGPLKLEHEPPFPRFLSMAGLRELYNRIGQPDRMPTLADFCNEEADSVSLTTTATDSEYENCFLPFCGALPQPSGGSPAATYTASSLSASASTNHEPQWLPLLVARVVSSKARKACQALKKKLVR